MLASAQVEPSVAGVGIRRQRELGVEADDRHAQHNVRLCHTPVLDAVVADYAPADA